jgi:hypothetical protein
MKYVAAMVSLAALAGCEYLVFEFPPAKPEKPKPPAAEKPPEEKPAPPEREKPKQEEPEYKPPDFPFFDDKDEEPMKLGPNSSYNVPAPRGYYYGNTFNYPAYWFGPYRIWNGWGIAPAGHLHEHHNHGTGQSTFEFTPGAFWPYGWGWTYEHHHH